jgi:polyisoprenoid-binding protein YceI
MIRLDAGAARCRVFTFKEGLLAAAAHDLELEVTRFSVEVELEAGEVDARFDAASLRVVQALAAGRPALLSARDRQTIERHIVEDVLHAARFPEVRFRGRSRADGAALDGTLTLHGRERQVQVALGRDGDARTGEATLHQPDFGITPFSALLGTLRVRPDVRIRFTATF